jgi:hypothetical protein
MAKPSSASLQQSAYSMKPALLGEPSTGHKHTHCTATNRVVSKLVVKWLTVRLRLLETPV